MASYSDDFNRADNATLGANWTVITSGLGVASNTAKNSSGGSPQVFYASALASSNHYAQASIQFFSSGVGVTCRHSGTTTGTMNGYLANNQTGVRLFKYVNGTFTQLGSTVSITQTLGDVYRVTANGSTITADVNGVNQITQTDTAVASGTGAGIRVSGLNGAVDNWAAADLATAASPAPENRLVRRNSLLRR